MAIDDVESVANPSLPFLFCIYVLGLLKNNINNTLSCSCKQLKMTD